MRHAALLGFFVFTTFAASILTAAEPYWNQFRGPHANGETNAQLPTEFDDEQNVVWKTPIHGKGWSSPVVWGDQVWLTTATEDGKQLSAICVDANTGQIQHDLLVFEVVEPKFCHPTNSYASCTPFVEEGRVYVHFGEYGTACLDTTTGNKIWERRDFVSEDFRGPASSPIVVGERLFINFDGVDHQFMVALDKQTGKTIWRAERDIDYQTDDGDMKKAYGTPALIEVNGQQQLISTAAVETLAHDPATGDVIWRVHNDGYNGSARPLFENGLVYICAGRGDLALLAVKPDGTGDVSQTHLAWSTGKSVPRFSSQIVIGDRLYMINDTGVISCLNALDGSTIWTKRQSGEYWASPLYSEGNLYFLSKEGAVLIVAAADEFQLVAEKQFPAGFNASPAVVGDSLVLRSFTHLYRIGH
ncbi:MAG: PQQ-binding-like beta-propeller repeat protein [Bythopirellula sp.]|nr:PQQ-binding-like beta-propeller repeat protein [Bythopirellula sp.]